MTEEDSRKKGVGIIVISMVVVGLVLFGLMAVCIAAYNGISERANAMKDLSNSKSIVLALKVYAVDHDGNYPQVGDEVEKILVSGKTVRKVVDPNSDSVFDALVPEYMPSEQIFWNHRSDRRQPDGDGHLEKGENHYSYVGGLSDSSAGSAPLLFHAPGELEPEMRWFSYWPSRFSRPVRRAGVAFGASGSELETVVVRNDGSSNLVPLDSDGTMKAGHDFRQNIPEELETRILHPGWLTPLPLGE